MKPLLIIYLNVDGVPTEEVPRYVDSAIVGLDDLKDEYSFVMMPVRNQPTKVECVNPVIVPSEFYEKYKFEFKAQMTCKLKKLMKVVRDEQN